MGTLTGTQNSSSLHRNIIDALPSSNIAPWNREGSRGKGEKGQHIGHLCRDTDAGDSWEKGEHLLQDQWLHQGGLGIGFLSLHNCHLTLSHNLPQN